jgi:hypothetical protein
MTLPAASPGPSWLDTVQVQRYDRLYDARPSVTLTLGAALDAIVEGAYAHDITRLRQLYARHGEATYTMAKRQLPQITFGGTFSPTRAKTHLTQHSGIVHADLDHLQALNNTKLALMQDPCVVYIFRSPRGDGLKFGVHIATVDSDAAYQYAWQVVADRYQAQYGVMWDPSGKDVCRLCFVSWDPACFINPDAALFPVPPPPAPRPSPVIFRHWPSSRLQTAAQRALNRAERLIAHAPAGARHSARLKASYLVGGYLASTELSYDEALARLTSAALANADDEREACRDITDGLEAGQSAPITNPTPHRPRGDWHSRASTPQEASAWRKC